MHVDWIKTADSPCLLNFISGYMNVCFRTMKKTLNVTKQELSFSESGCLSVYCIGNGCIAMDLTLGFVHGYCSDIRLKRWARGAD